MFDFTVVIFVIAVGAGSLSVGYLIQLEVRKRRRSMRFHRAVLRAKDADAGDTEQHSQLSKSDMKEIFDSFELTEYVKDAHLGEDVDQLITDFARAYEIQLESVRQEKYRQTVATMNELDKLLEGSNPNTHTISDNE